MLEKNFNDLWPEGVDSLRAELVSEGFQDLELEVCEGVHWPHLNELLHYYLSKGDLLNSWGYLAESTATKWPAEFALMVAHPNRRKDLPEIVKGHIFWTKHPEAALDWMIQKLQRNYSLPEYLDSIPKGVSAEPHVLIASDAQIGEGTILEAGVRIGPGAKIGKNCFIGAYTSIGADCIVGDECELGHHCSIGGRGLGVITYPRSPEKVVRKHIGRVRLGNYVSFGNQVCIDRAVFGETIIDDEVCTDNNVQVAHNCVVGAQSILCAFIGLSGSTILGKNCVFAGAAGTKGHLTIGDNVTVGAQTGVTTDLASNQFVKGYPALPLQKTLKIESLKTRLPEIYSRLKKVEKKIFGTNKES